MQEPSDLRARWRKFAKNVRTCLVKQDQAGSYMYVGYSLKL